MEIYSTLVSEILKYYYDVEDINGNDYDEFESAQNIFLLVKISPFLWISLLQMICVIL